MTKRRMITVLAALSLLLCGSLPAAQDDAAPALPGLATADGEGGAGQLSAQELNTQLSRHLQHIEQLETELGWSDPALIEAYSDLAAWYREHDMSEEAMSQLTQALYLSRIATGLQSERQLPIVNQIIDTASAAGDWVAVDKHKALAFYIGARAFSPDDMSYVEMVDDYGRWKTRLVRENLLGLDFRSRNRLAEDASEFYRRELARIEEEGVIPEAELVSLIHGKSQIDIEVAQSVAATPYTYFEGTASRYVSETVCDMVRDANGKVSRVCYSVQRENPRYRESQRDAKRFAVQRYLRSVELAITRLETIQNQPVLTAEERDSLTTQIREMEVAADRIGRSARRY
ncbi:MAG: hypothetical protein WDZ76_02085 [Pseudohongiellaceae bacterium]